MNTESSTVQPSPRRTSVFRNWLSLAGLVIVVGSVFSFALLLLLDALAHFSNPYVGILTYLVAPGFFVIGSLLAVTGAFLRRRQIVKYAGPFPPLRIDLTRPRDRRLFGFFLAGRGRFPPRLSDRLLSNLSLHRVRAILRPGLPRRHETGIGHLPAFAACPCRLR